LKPLQPDRKGEIQETAGLPGKPTGKRLNSLRGINADKYLELVREIKQISNEVDWMKFKKSENRSMPLGKMLLFCCIVLGLMTVFSAAAAQGDVLTLIKMPLEDSSANNYGELAYALPSRVNVTPDSLEVSEYTGGKELIASIFLNGSKIAIHQLYPCQAPQTLLEPDVLKSLLNAYDPTLMQTNYSEELLGISGKPAIWGQVGSLILAAYQPTNQTAALIVMDIALPEETMAYFLGNLSITLNEGVTPITPGYCPDTTVATAEAEVQNTTSGQATENEVTPAEAEVQNTASSQATDEKLTPVERMKAKQERLKAEMDEKRKKMMGN
jgi:hypothetical protein